MYIIRSLSLLVLTVSTNITHVLEANKINKVILWCQSSAAVSGITVLKGSLKGWTHILIGLSALLLTCNVV